MAAAAILKMEKSPNLGRSLTDFDQIWHDNRTALIGQIPFCCQLASILQRARELVADNLQLLYCKSTAESVLKEFLK